MNVEEHKMPAGWVWTSMGSITVNGPQNGLYLSQAIYGTGIPILRIDDFQDGESRSSSQLRLVNAQKEDIARYSLRQNDLVINRVNSPSHLGKCLLVAERNLPALFESNMMRICLSESIDGKFVALYLRSSFGRSRLISNAKWAVNQASINQNDVGNTPLPLAPLCEQHRIVEAIEQQFTRLDAGVAALQHAKTKLKRYRAAVLKAAVEGKLTEAWRAEHPTTEPASMLLERILKERRDKWEADLRAKGRDPAKVKYVEPAGPEVESLPELPGEWVWVNLGQLTWSVKDGPHYSPKYVSEGIPFITGGNVRPSGVDFANAKRITPELYEELSQRCKPEKGDILYTKGGTTGIARVNTYDNKFSVWVHVAVLKLAGHINSFYVQHILNSPFCYDQAQRFTHGVGNQDLGLTRMIRIVLGLPPLAEQEQIVAEVERRLSVISQLEVTVEANLKRAERLRQSILSEAFAGRLVPQDTNDEPASVLLERIRGERGSRERKNGPGASKGDKGRTVKVPEPGVLDVRGTEQVELWEGVGG